jgi:hypothetical protein
MHPDRLEARDGRLKAKISSSPYPKQTTTHGIRVIEYGMKDTIFKLKAEPNPIVENMN